MARSRTHKRMYAVSCDGIGLIAGTLAYTRREAIKHATSYDMERWEEMRRAGYRTVVAMVKIIMRKRRE